MKNKIEEEIKKITENISILPLNNKANRKKYIEYIDTVFNEYNNYLEIIQKEINKRYNKIKLLEENNTYNEAIAKTYNMDKIDIHNKNISSYHKMGIDVMLHNLKQFYKQDLANLNKNILEIISSFQKVGINLSLNDYNYSSYQKEYLKELLDHNNDYKMQEVFEKLYWKCPDLVNNIRLNFISLYFKNQDKINNYYLKEKSQIKEIILDYNNNLKTINLIKRNNKKIIYDRFLNKELTTSELDNIKIDKLRERIINQVEIENQYNNLLDLEETLLEYKNYLQYEFILNKVKELYKNKDSYKGLFNNKLKEIKGKEKEIFKLNNKLKPSFLNHPKPNKISEINLNIQNKINEISNLYSELLESEIKEYIYNNLNDDSKNYEALEIAINNYDFIYKTYKEQDDSIKKEIILKNILDIQKFLYHDSLSIINNIFITSDKNIAEVICDRYKMLNINIKAEEITTESIDNLLHDIDILLTYEDMKKSNILLEDIIFIMEVDKKNILTK